MSLRKPIFLLGEATETIIGHKLPTNKQVLQLLFYHTRQSDKTLAVSYRLVIKEVSKFWERAGIYVQTNTRCVAKLEKLYTKYRNVQKSLNSTCKQEFSEYLEKLFDIACGNIQNMVDSEGMKFLHDQRTERKYHLRICKQKEDSIHIQLFGKLE